MTLRKGQTFKKINVIRKPLTANDGKIIFTSSKPKVVKVTSKGTIKGLKKGRATITVKAGKKAKKIDIIVK